MKDDEALALINQLSLDFLLTNINFYHLLVVILIQ